jgi:hypothetical protein
MTPLEKLIFVNFNIKWEKLGGLEMWHEWGEEERV